MPLRVAVLAALLLALAPVAAHAATFSVNSTTDAVDASPGNGVCATGGGACTLRAAVQEANASLGADTIDVPAGTYQLTIAGADDTAAAGDLDVTGALTILGTSGDPSNTTISAGTNLFNGIDKIFSFNPNGAASAGFAVSLSNLTLAFGHNTSGPGGAFDFDAGSAGTGSLTMSNDVVSSNAATASNGGGLALLDGGTISISGSTFENDRAGLLTAATPLGGAIYVGMPQGSAHRTFTLTGSLLDGDQAGGAGGAIAFDGLNNASAVVSDTIQSSFIFGNTAGTIDQNAGGGAIYVAASPGTLTLDGNTLSSNTATGDGGAVDVVGAGTTSIQHSAFEANSANTTSGRGGGIALGAGNATVAFDRIVGNHAATGTGVAKNDDPGTATLTNDWWGCNGGPSAVSCDTAAKVSGGAGGGTLAIPDWLVLHAAFSPATIDSGGKSTLQADLLTNSSGAAVTPSDLSIPDLNTVNFANIQGGTMNLPFANFSAGVATGTFTAGSTEPLGSVDVSLDHATVTATVAVHVVVSTDLQPFVVPTPLTGPVLAGSNGGVDNLLYTVTLANAGPHTVTSAQMAGTLTLPAGVTASIDTPSLGTATYDPITGAIAWDVGVLKPGDAPQLLVHVNVSNTAADGAQISLSETSSLAADNESDSAPGNDTSSSTVTVQGAPAVTFSPTSIDFGQQRVGTVSGDRQILVTNTGSSPLHITGASLTGTNASQFAIDQDTCTGQTLATLSEDPNGGCEILVKFAPRLSRLIPGGTGTVSISLSLTSDAPTSPDSVPITGTSTRAIFSASPSPFDFGDQRVQTPSAPQAFTITNTGTATLDIPAGGIILTGADTSSFGITSDGCSGQSLAAGGGHCEVDVRFEPITAGSKSAAIHVVDNTLDSSDDISLSGNGTAPAFASSPASQDFGSHRVGTHSAQQTFTITNPGNAALNISSVALGGTNPGQFTLVSDGCSGQALAPSSDSCAIVARFDPTASGAKSAQIVVGSDTLTSPDTIALSGTGVVSAFLATPASKDFGSVARNTTSANQTFTITNPGSAPLDISTVTLGGTNASEFQLVSTTCAGQAVAPGTGSCQIVARFSPTSATLGAKSASLAIASDAPTTPDHIALSATSIQPAPIVTTSAATSVGPTSATLHGTVDPQFSSTTAHFEWGTTTAYGTSTPSVTVGSSGIASLSAALSKLKNKTTYHFRLVATNAGGTSRSADRTFTTMAPPSKTSSASAPLTLSVRVLTRNPYPAFDRFTVEGGGPLLQLGRGSLAVGGHGAVSMPLTCGEVSGACRVTVSLTVAEHGRTVTVAHRMATVSGSGRHRVALRLTPAGRALLAETHALRVRVRISASDEAGSATLLARRRLLGG